MSHNKVYSLLKVPFSWENSPGICKVNDHKEGSKGVGDETRKLPPPPCRVESRRMSDPWPFQLTLRSATMKELEREDPFLAAYLECTKTVSKDQFCKGDNHKKGSRVRGGRRISIFSCKHSCGVREDSLVRMAYVPTSPNEFSRREMQRSKSLGGGFHCKRFHL